MIMRADVEDQLRARSFAIIQAHLPGDLEALGALVNDDDAGELLVMVTEVLTGALVRLVGPDELDEWLDARRTRLAG
jgi:hypothetical protein